ncbi:MAG: DUF3189 family protein [Patescibacteria group bacterium]
MRIERIVYQCRSGAHAAPVAAAIHLGLLPAGRRPTRREIAAVPGFDRLGPHDLGFLHACGRGPDGCEVFVMGVGRHADLARRAAGAAGNLAGLDPLSFAFVDCSRVPGPLWQAAGRLVQLILGRGARRAFLAAALARSYPVLARIAGDGGRISP